MNMSPEIIKKADLTSVLFEISNARTRCAHDPNLRKQVHELYDGFVVFYDGIPERGRALRFGINGPVEVRVIEEVERLFHEYDVPVKFIVNPCTNTNFTKTLGNRGYGISNWMNVMVRPLNIPLPDRIPVHDFLIETVTPASKGQFGVTMAAGFASLGIPYLNETSMHDIIPAMENSFCYLAKQGNLHVGAASMIILENWAYLFTASTLPEFRKHGLQSNFITLRLEEARRQGCEHAMIIVQPGSGSQRNAERFGFHIAYSRPTLRRDF